MAEAVATGGFAGVGEAPATVPPAALGYRRYALVLLLIIYMLNFLDRQLVTILVEPIKKTFHLSDTQLGLMAGPVFALFYTFFGIPIGELGKRFNRPWILAGSMALWSGFTVLSGRAIVFPQLLLARLGVGFGEAGCTPMAHSMIADDTPQKDRNFALAFYAMGTPLGTLLGLVIGGVVAGIWGWRAAFLVAGLPGLIFALVAGFTLKEPRRRLGVVHTQAGVGWLSDFGETFSYLLKKPTFWYCSLAAALSAFIGYGQQVFIASFFLRNHTADVAALAAHIHLPSLGFLGIALGLIGGLSGAFGSIFGGKLTDWGGLKSAKAFVTFPAIAAVIWTPLNVMAILAPSSAVALAILILPGVLATFWYGPIYGTVQSIVPPRMRATAAALLLFIINIIGLGLGPLAYGALSDHLATTMGTALSIKWTLVFGSGFAAPVIALLLLARACICEDIVS